MAAVVTAALLAFSCPVGSAVAAEGDADILEAMRFRVTVGFRSDRAYVEATLKDPEAFADTEWGVPLAQSEAAELSRRVEVQEAMRDATAFAASRGDYAGIYYDQLDGGLPVFLFTSDATQLGESVAALLPEGTRFRLETVKRSWADLEAIKAEIGRARAQHGAIGVDVILTGIRTPLNRVTVGVAGDVGKAADYFEALYCEAVGVEAATIGIADACTTVNSCWPPKGGIDISKGSGHCTSGWIAERAGTGQLVVVTAGHCIAAAGGSGVVWYHDGNSIGGAQGDTWIAGADADVGLIGIYTSKWPATRNQFLAGQSPLELRQVTDFFATSEQHVGSLVCRFGRASLKTCGTIYRVNVTKPSCVGSTCKMIDHQIEVDFDSTNGDSGGPYFTAYTGYGVHTHSDADPQAPMGGIRPPTGCDLRTTTLWASRSSTV